MSAAESPASSTTLYAYLSTLGISVPEEVGEHWRPEAVGKLSVGKVLDLAALRKDSGVVACICRVGPLFVRKWMARKGRLYSRQEHFRRWLVVWLQMPSVVVKTVILLHPRHFSEVHLLVRVSHRRAIKKQAGKEMRDPRALQNTLTMILFCQNLPLQSLWFKALCQAGLQQLCWRRGGTLFAVLRDGSNVFVIALHAYEEHGGANFG